MLFVAENFNEGLKDNIDWGEGYYTGGRDRKRCHSKGVSPILLSVILFKFLVRKHRKTIITKIPIIPK